MAQGHSIGGRIDPSRSISEQLGGVPNVQSAITNPPVASQPVATGHTRYWVGAMRNKESVSAHAVILHMRMIDGVDCVILYRSEIAAVRGITTAYGKSRKWDAVAYPCCGEYER